MMTDRVPPPVTVPGGVPWDRLYRNTMHRTSAPTNVEVREALREVSLARGGGRRTPAVDAVIFAAVALARRGDQRLLLAEVERIEAGTYIDPPRGRVVEPGS